MRALPFALLLVLAACGPTDADAPEAPPELEAADLAAAPALPEVPEAEPGDVAPSFTLAGMNGETVSLDSLRGETVVLEWLNYDCPFVGKHYGGGAMQALQTAATGRGVVWLSIVSSAPGEQGHFAPDDMAARTQQEGGRQSHVLLDEDGTVGRLYGAKTTPHMFVIDPEGVIRYNGAIDDRPTSDPADLDGAQPYAADALEATLAGTTPDPDRTTPYGCSVKYADA